MPFRLEDSCRCGTVSFFDSHTPYPYQRCYSKRRNLWIE